MPTADSFDPLGVLVEDERVEDPQVGQARVQVHAKLVRTEADAGRGGQKSLDEDAGAQRPRFLQHHLGREAEGQRVVAGAVRVLHGDHGAVSPQHVLPAVARLHQAAGDRRRGGRRPPRVEGAPEVDAEGAGVDRQQVVRLGDADARPRVPCRRLGRARILDRERGAGLQPAVGLHVDQQPLHVPAVLPPRRQAVGLGRERAAVRAGHANRRRQLERSLGERHAEGERLGSGAPRARPGESDLDPLVRAHPFRPPILGNYRRSATGPSAPAAGVRHCAR